MSRFIDVPAASTGTKNRALLRHHAMCSPHAVGRPSVYFQKRKKCPYVRKDKTNLSNTIRCRRATFYGIGLIECTGGRETAMICLLNAYSHRWARNESINHAVLDWRFHNKYMYEPNVAPSNTFRRVDCSSWVFIFLLTWKICRTKGIPAKRVFDNNYRSSQVQSIGRLLSTFTVRRAAL